MTGLEFAVFAVIAVLWAISFCAFDRQEATQEHDDDQARVGNLVNFDRPAPTSNDNEAA